MMTFNLVVASTEMPYFAASQARLGKTLEALQPAGSPEPLFLCFIHNSLVATLREIDKSLI